MIWDCECEFSNFNYTTTLKIVAFSIETAFKHIFEGDLLYCFSERPELPSDGPALQPWTALPPPPALPQIPQDPPPPQLWQCKLIPFSQHATPAGGIPLTVHFSNWLEKLFYKARGCKPFLPKIYKNLVPDQKAKCSWTRFLIMINLWKPCRAELLRWGYKVCLTPIPDICQFWPFLHHHTF